MRIRAIEDGRKMGAFISLGDTVSDVADGDDHEVDMSSTLKKRWH